MASNKMRPIENVSVLKRIHDDLRHKANHDSMTGLLNREAVLDEIVGALLLRAEIWVVMADVDGLKAINDTLGHQAGDLALRVVANAMNRPEAIVGRYGGDEFIAVLVNASAQDAERYCANVYRSLVASNTTDPRTKMKIKPDLSMGMASYPSDAPSLVALLAAADTAMYEEKRRFREQYAA